MMAGVPALFLGVQGVVARVRTTDPSRLSWRRARAANPGQPRGSSRRPTLQPRRPSAPSWQRGSSGCKGSLRGFAPRTQAASSGAGQCGKFRPAARIAVTNRTRLGAPTSAPVRQSGSSGCKGSLRAPCHRTKPCGRLNLRDLHGPVLTHHAPPAPAPPTATVPRCKGCHRASSSALEVWAAKSGPRVGERGQPHQPHLPARPPRTTGANPAHHHRPTLQGVSSRFPPAPIATRRADWPPPRPTASADHRRRTSRRTSVGTGSAARILGVHGFVARACTAGSGRLRETRTVDAASANFETNAAAAGMACTGDPAQLKPAGSKYSQSNYHKSRRRRHANRRGRDGVRSKEARPVLGLPRQSGKPQTRQLRPDRCRVRDRRSIEPPSRQEDARPRPDLPGVLGVLAVNFVARPIRHRQSADVANARCDRPAPPLSLRAAGEAIPTQMRTRPTAHPANRAPGQPRARPTAHPDGDCFGPTPQRHPGWPIASPDAEDGACDCDCMRIRDDGSRGTCVEPRIAVSSRQPARQPARGGLQ
jgi:hypothetical protein